MDKLYHTLIVGGGAAGLIAAARLADRYGGEIAVAERGERLGRKLSLSGNGQGNLTNSDVSPAHYRSGEKAFPAVALKEFPFESAERFYRTLGIFLTREAGKYYPLSKQASAVTDALRCALEREKVVTKTGFCALKAEKQRGVFTVTAEDGRRLSAKHLILAFGGKAAKHLGTDGTSYALAEGFGHRITAVYPALVQLTTQTEPIRGLKGIKAEATVFAEGRYRAESRGEVLFTDYGVSGSAIFSVSGAVSGGGRIEIGFLPEVSEQELIKMLKARAALGLPLAGGIVHNQLARVLEKQARGEIGKLASLIKKFSLPVTGSLGFDAAQVSAGGVDVCDIDARTMESKLVRGLYFAGEAMDVDGDCGGYNLHWAYASASAAAAHLLQNGETANGKTGEEDGA